MTSYHLSVINRQRVVFDPSNPDHILEFAGYAKYRKWKDGCPFYLEDPYTDIPTMLYTKVAQHSVRHLMERI